MVSVSECAGRYSVSICIMSIKYKYLWSQTLSSAQTLAHELQKTHTGLNLTEFLLSRLFDSFGESHE